MKKLKYILIIYSLFIFIIYFLRPLFSNDAFNFYSQFSLPYMFNFIPFQTNIKYILNPDRYNNIYLVINLLVPPAIFVPYGFLGSFIIKNRDSKFLKSSLIFIAIVSVIFMFRPLLKIAFFDIDKIILFYLGLFIGHILYKLFIKINPKFNLNKSII